MERFLEPDISEDIRNVNLGYFLSYEKDLFCECPVQISPLLLKLYLSNLVYCSVFEVFLLLSWSNFTVIMCFAYMISFPFFFSS